MCTTSALLKPGMQSPAPPLTCSMAAWAQPLDPAWPSMSFQDAVGLGTQKMPSSCKDFRAGTPTEKQSRTQEQFVCHLAPCTWQERKVPSTSDGFPQARIASITARSHPGQLPVSPTPHRSSRLLLPWPKSAKALGLPSGGLRFGSKHAAKRTKHEEFRSRCCGCECPQCRFCWVSPASSALKDPVSWSGR